MRKTFRRFLCALPAAIIFCIGSAAGSYPGMLSVAGGNSVDATIANHVWHGPCGGNWTIEYTNHTPAGMPSNWVGYAPYYGCKVTLRPWLKGAARCTTIEHEVGHLAGYEHSPDPNSVMYPKMLRNSPECMKAYNAGLTTDIPRPRGPLPDWRFALTPHPQ